MSTFGTYHAKTHFTDLLNRVAAGEVITITRHGRPIAKMVPVDREAPDEAVLEVVRGLRRLRETIARRGGGCDESVVALIREGRRH